MNPASQASGDDPDVSFRLLIDESPRGHAIVRGLRCLYCNPAFARLFGMASPQAVLDLGDLSQLVTPEGRAELERDVSGLAGPGAAGLARKCISARRGDGSTGWIELDARRVRWNGGPALHLSGRDVTEEHRAESDRDLLMRTVLQSHEAIYVTDAEGTILLANPAMAQLTGAPLEEIVGANPRKFKSGTHDAAFYAALWKTLLAGNTWSGRLVNRRVSGEFYHVDTRISPVRDELGRISHFIGVQRDVTETLALEQRLRHAEKMETVGQLAGGVAHDFNNLLQVIAGWTQLLLEDLPGDDGRRRGVERIDEAVQRASALTRQLLAMSRKTVLQSRKIDVDRLLAAQGKLLERLLGAQVSLKVLPSAEPMWIEADPGMVEQVVMNLCVNARDAMPDGGTVVVELLPVTLDAGFRASHPWSREGEFVRLSVCDTGVGMSPEVQRKIFDPFFTTKEPGKGTGLGLSTVMGIVQQHSGLLHVYSEPGMGSMFHVYFPRLLNAPTEAAAVAPDAPPRAGQGERILLVEDDPAVVEFTAEALRRGGYTVVTACDGQDAVDRFLRDTQGFALVILDLVLPKLSGRQAHGLIGRLRPETRFVFQSGYSPHVLDLEFIVKSGMPLLQKPFSPRDLLQAVRRTLDRAEPAVPATTATQPITP